jgi:hypothetical protein
MSDRALSEPIWLDALARTSEGQSRNPDIVNLAGIVIDLIKLTGDQPDVAAYLNQRLAKFIELSEQQPKRESRWWHRDS